MTEKRIAFHVELTPDCKNKLTKISEMTERTRSQMIRYLIEREYKKLNNIFDQSD